MMRVFVLFVACFFVAACPSAKEEVVPQPQQEAPPPVSVVPLVDPQAAEVPAVVKAPRVLTKDPGSPEPAPWVPNVNPPVPEKPPTPAMIFPAYRPCVSIEAHGPIYESWEEGGSHTMTSYATRGSGVCLKSVRRGESGYDIYILTLREIIAPRDKPAEKITVKLWETEETLSTHIADLLAQEEAGKETDLALISIHARELIALPPDMCCPFEHYYIEKTPVVAVAMRHDGSFDFTEAGPLSPAEFRERRYAQLPQTFDDTAIPSGGVIITKGEHHGFLGIVLGVSTEGTPFIPEHHITEWIGKTPYQFIVQK